MASKLQLMIVVFTTCILHTTIAQEAVVTNTLPSQIEEGSEFDVCVELISAPPSSTPVVEIVTMPITARVDVDYSSVNTLLTFEPSSSTTEQCVTISIFEDDAIESLDFFTVTVSSNDVTLTGSNTLSAVIRDTTVPTLEFGECCFTVNEAEDDDNLVCIVPINTVFEDATGATSTIEVSAIEGSATANGDYAFLTGLKTFLPSTPPEGLCFSPGIINDDITEDLESYTLSFTYPTFPSVNGSTTIHIQDDDGVNITFAQADYSMNEGNDGMSPTVDVCLTITPPSGGLGRDVVINLTAVGDTTEPDDFEPFSQVQLTYTGSSTTQCQTVTINGDDFTEPDESLYVVGTPQNSLDMFVGPDQVSIIILDDSDALCRSLSDPSNGGVQVTGSTIGSTATYTCNEGYELSQAAMGGRQTCMTAVGWSPDLSEPICTLDDTMATEPGSSASFLMFSALILLLVNVMAVLV